MNWFKVNHVIADPDKFLDIRIEKKGRDRSRTQLSINDKIIESSFQSHQI